MVYGDEALHAPVLLAIARRFREQNLVHSASTCGMVVVPTLWVSVDAKSSLWRRALPQGLA